MGTRGASTSSLSQFLPQLLYETMDSTSVKGANGEIRCDIMIVDDNPTNHAPIPTDMTLQNTQTNDFTPKLGNKAPRKRLRCPCRLHPLAMWNVVGRVGQKVEVSRQLL